MVCDFTQRKNSNEILEEKLDSLKQEYLKPQMKAQDMRKLLEIMDRAKKRNQSSKYRSLLVKFASVAAAILAVVIILPNTSATVAHAMSELPIVGSLIEVVTFRDYRFESQRNNADIEVPQIVPTNSGQDEKVQETLEQSINEINADIQKITNEIIAEFETYLGDEQGYQDYVVKSEILTTTETYFCVKLMCYQGAGSGYQWNYYYTVDLKTGELLKLKDLFLEGADYLTPISDSIKKQMQQNMDADEDVHYWLHDEIEDLNFKTITEDTKFYVNKSGNIVIAFDEGDVAPMYMGALEFEIPNEVLTAIRK